MKKMALIVLLLAFSASLSARELTLSQLNKRVLQLEKRIKRLERLLLKQGRDSGLPRVPTGRAAWRRLRRGMNLAQVRRLLGEPRRVFVLGIQTHWHYTGGTVVFAHNRLVMWSEEDRN